ncbi:hypothetical protein BTR40_04960 [Vibrio parahaemolyticus]|nr:hypothetical protein BTR40_04960 [Vibrio parahaemolyticus]
MFQIRLVAFFHLTIGERVVSLQKLLRCLNQSTAPNLVPLIETSSVRLTQVIH